MSYVISDYVISDAWRLDPRDEQIQQLVMDLHEHRVEISNLKEEVAHLKRQMEVQKAQMHGLITCLALFLVKFICDVLLGNKNIGSKVRRREVASWMKDLITYMLGKDFFDIMLEEFEMENPCYANVRINLHPFLCL